jgi:enamidase
MRATGTCPCAPAGLDGGPELSGEREGGETRVVLLRNLGGIVTGDVDRPTVDGDAIRVQGPHIAGIGAASALDDVKADTVVDAQGMVAVPGLIDSHIHPVIGDWTPRMNAFGWLAAYVQAGITTATSQGSWALGGYPEDPRGMVAFGITLARAFANFRPGGMKVHGAAVSLVGGLKEQDFELLSEEGVWLIAEVGSRSIVEPSLVRDLLEMAHRHGFVSRVHFGPEAVPGTFTVTAEMAATMRAHIASHVNGGPTSPPDDDLDFVVDEMDCYLELSYPGNHRALLRVAQRARDRGELRRLIAGSDTPTGVGILPRAILQTAGLLATFLEIPPAQAFAVGSGNTARAYRLNTGRLEVGREADILLVDAPKSSQAVDGLEALAIGDLPSIGMVMIDGEIVSLQTSNTLPAKRRVAVRKQ